MAVPRFNEEGRPDYPAESDGPVLPEGASEQEKSAAWEAMAQERMFWLLYPELVTDSGDVDR